MVAQTTVPAAIAGLLLTYGIVESPEQAAALNTMLAAIGVLVYGQFMSKDGDK